MIVQTTITDNKATVVPAPVVGPAEGRVAEAGCVVQLTSIDPATGKGVFIALSPEEFRRVYEGMKQQARRMR